MKILWGVDPFHQTSSQIKRTYSLIKAIAGGKSGINVGFIVTRTESDLSLAFDIPESKRFSEYPKSLLQKKLKSAGIPLGPSQVHVVDHPTFSTTEAAERFFKLAREKGCGTCVVFSQAGERLRKFFLGSFAESAVHVTDRSLIVTSPHSQLPSQIKVVFYCYEPGPGADRALQKAIQFCSEVKAKLVVFHATQVDVLNYQDATQSKKHLKKLEQMADSIEKGCAKRKVQCQVVFSSEFKMVSELVIKYSKSMKADIIAVVAKSGRGMAFMGGSVTRQILKASSLPVMVIR